MATLVANTVCDSHKISPWCVEKDPHFSRQSTAASDDDDSGLTGLQQAALAHDWKDRIYSATLERCALLQYLATEIKARKALEVGSLCGTASLALAEVLPDNGDMQALEFDKTAVEFGRPFISKAAAGNKVTTHVGNPVDLIAGFVDQTTEPFDFVLINSGVDMKRCFDLMWEAPGFLSPGVLVCMDTSGAQKNDQVCEMWAGVASSLDKVALDLGGLMIVQRSSCA